LGGESVVESANALPPFATIPSLFTADFGRTNLNIARVALSYRL
jgi:hypothetical protein